MANIVHSITLDLSRPASVEAINIYGSDNPSASHAIVAKITDNHKPVDLSQYEKVRLKIQRITERITGVTTGDTVTFNGLYVGNEYVKDGWSVASVELVDDSGKIIETQQFQIYQESFASREVDASSIEKLTFSDSQIDKISKLIAGYEKYESLTEKESELTNLYNNREAINDAADKTPELVNKLSGIGSDERAIKQVKINYSQPDSEQSTTSQLTTDGIAELTLPVGSVFTNKANSYSNAVDDNGVALINLKDLVNNLEVKIATNDDSSTIYNNVVDDSGNITITIPEVQANVIEKISHNGTDVTPDENKKVSIKSVASVDVEVGDNSTKTITPISGKISIKSGNGVNLHTNENSLTIECDVEKLDLTPSNIAGGSGNSNYIMAVDGNGNAGWYPIGNFFDAKNNTFNNSYNFSFDGFKDVDEIDDNEKIPFSATIEDGGTTGKVITWGNLMKLFKQTHRTVYIPIKIESEDWHGDMASIKILKTNLDTDYDINHEELTEDNHNHAHIHPEPASLVDYCNYGIYCTSIEEDDSNVLFNFKKNTTDTTPDINVVIEVRIG